MHGSSSGSIKLITTFISNSPHLTEYDHEKKLAIEKCLRSGQRMSGSGPN